MTGLTVHIPTLETERLILRAPRLEDMEPFMAFLRSDRSEFVGGPVDDQRTLIRAFGHFSGQWVMRGYGLLIGALKSNPDHPIGGFGIFQPYGHPEPEFGWSLYDGADEGQGYVTEAMRTYIPWAWGVLTEDTAVSHIDEGNTNSENVAKALGASLDEIETEAASMPGHHLFEEDGPRVQVFRHQRGGLT